MRAHYFVALFTLVACSQNETPSSAVGGAGSSGATAPTAGAANDFGGEGSGPAPTTTGGSNVGGTNGSGEGSGGSGTGGNVSSGGIGPAGAAGTVASGGLWGNDSESFPTLKPPLSLPQEPAAAACPDGSVIESTTTAPLYAWPGVVFGSVAPSGQGENHAPAKLGVKVTKAGAPVANCEVRFVAEAGNGWAFGATRVTDAQGKLYGYWTAQQPGNAKISAVIALASGGQSKVELTGKVADNDSRTDSVHLYFDVDASYTEFTVRATPLSAPPSTYYSALNWNDAYAGIQFDGATTTVIFSVWDAGGEKAKITDPGACNAKVDFGGEGTGTSCRLKFPPSKNGAVAGLPDDYRLEVGNTYELHLSLAPSSSGGTANTLTFTDRTRGIGPISLGTQTTGTKLKGGGFASAFVEEWTDHGNCLSNARSVLYHGTRAKVAGAWQDVKSASFSPNYKNDNNEVCSNYLATRYENTWLMSSGGEAYVGRPFVPGDNAFKSPQPAIELP